MEKINQWLHSKFSLLVKAILFLGSVLIIVWLFPGQARFGHDYQEGRPWLDDDLIAPYNFAILKTQQVLEKERDEITRNFKPFLRKDPVLEENAKTQFIANFNAKWDTVFGFGPGLNKAANSEIGMMLFDSIFAAGVINVDDLAEELVGEGETYLVEGNVARIRQAGSFLTPKNAFLWADKQLERHTGFVKEFLLDILKGVLIANVSLDREQSQMALTEELDAISKTRGMVQEGERVISRGEVVSPEKFRILESFKAEYQKRAAVSSTGYLLFVGRFLLVSISLLLLFFFLKFFRREVFPDNRRISLILLIMILMVLITSTLVRYNIDLLFFLPVCITPILARAFFDSRIALYVHINTIIIIGFLVPRSFDFVFLQFIAGIVAIFSMVNLKRRSQLFVSVCLIFITYSAVYTGLTLARSGNLNDLSWVSFLQFGGAAMLTLLVYPLVNIFEKLFGLPTDFSLLELADTNNKLLRELNLWAPGTFQHSLQVANLAEEAILEIGGNGLLTRTGALYHDVGKIKNPLFFSENQPSDYNPHDELSREESARVIINHVIDGIEMARSHRVPEYLIDFIRTHHGTTTAKYFFLMHQKENPDSGDDVKNFMYNGPRPFSKEMAVVMMADAVEAASRSIKKPTVEKLEELVENILDSQLHEKQFNNANITMRDITKVKGIFTRRLANIYHSRIAYPSSI